MSAGLPIWEEPVRGFCTVPGDFVALSGLDVFRRTLDSGLGPPIRYLSGLVPTAIEPDAPLGCAVQTACRLPRRQEQQTPASERTTKGWTVDE